MITKTKNDLSIKALFVSTLITSCLAAQNLTKDTSIAYQKSANKKIFRTITKEHTLIEMTTLVKWKVNSDNGGMIIGLTKTKDEAKVIIKDFAKRNRNSAYKITYPERQSTFFTEEVSVTEQTFSIKSFESLQWKKNYKILNMHDRVALLMLDEIGIDQAIMYYAKHKRLSKSKAKDKLFFLAEHYKDFVKL